MGENQWVEAGGRSLAWSNPENGTVDGEQLEMAGNLVDSMSMKFSEFYLENHYNEAILEIIDSR